jgi:hypothetical protein
MMTSRRRLLLLSALTVAACARTRGGADSSAAAVTDSVPGSVPGSERATSGAATDDVQRLEAEARALARTSGCERASQCRTAPLGSKACGGPRTYLVYCSLTTDSAALFRKLDELRRAEEVRNRREGAVSTCEMALPPQVEVVGGSCRAASGGSIPQ